MLFAVLLNRMGQEDFNREDGEGESSTEYLTV